MLHPYSGREVLGPSSSFGFFWVFFPEWQYGSNSSCHPRNRTGHGREGRRSEVNTQLPLSCRPWNELGCGPEPVPSLEPPPCLSWFFSKNLPSRPPITCLRDPFPSCWANRVTWAETAVVVYSQLSKTQRTTNQHAAGSCMFNLGSIFMVNDSLELSVIFVPLVLAEQTPMVEVFL